MSFNATEAIIELYMEKDRSTDEYIDFLSKVDLKKSKRNGPKTIHADLGKVRRKNASKGKSGALKGAAIGAGIGAAAVTTGKLVKKHKQKKEEEAAKKAGEETKSKKKGLFRKIISKESADQYNAIVDELQLRYESGELSLEDAQVIADKAAEEYLEDVVTEKIMDAGNTAAAVSIGAMYGTMGVNTALHKKTQKDIKKAKELRDTLLKIEKQVDTCEDENKRQELMKKFLKIRNEQLRILDKAEKRLKMHKKVNDAEPWVNRAALAINSLNIAQKGMKLVKMMENK